MFSWRRKAPRERRSKKKIANIDLKVPDVEWQTTGRNVRPPASNENPVTLCKFMAELDATTSHNVLR